MNRYICYVLDEMPVIVDITSLERDQCWATLKNVDSNISLRQYIQPKLFTANNIEIYMIESEWEFNDLKTISTTETVEFLIELRTEGRLIYKR